MRLFERQGFLETSVQAIADDAGLTKGAFYHHFGAKEDVLVEIQREYLDAQAAAVEELTASTQDPVTVLEGLVRLSVRSVDEYRAHVAIFLQDRRHLTGKRFATVKKRRDVVETAFVEALTTGMETGAFRRAEDPRVVAYGIIGMCAWVYQWFGGAGRLTLDQVADMYWSMIYDGLRTDR
jgi:AcrR family transcriptional regulator